jgi:hypothetical protein
VPTEINVAVVSSAVDVATAPTWEHVLLSENHVRVEFRRSPSDIDASFNPREHEHGS